MNQTAITYPATTFNELSVESIKTILEDICDNLFNPDPYLQQGGDMVRVGGMQYTCDPTRSIGHRISDMSLNGKPLDAEKKYQVAGWAPVGEGVTGQPVWEILTDYLRSKKEVAPSRLNAPRLIGMGGNPGIV